MIVCWVLFSMGAVTGLVGYAGYRVNEDPEIIIEPLALGEEFTTLEDMTPVKKRELAYADAQRRSEDQQRSIRRERFLTVAVVGGMFAGFLLLWNIVCHTAHWIWEGRRDS